MPRPSNREERRAQIVDGLMRVLPEHGYERASVARIAKAAGLSPGLVHHHFENKQAILLALGERLVALVRGRVADAPTARGRLHAFLDAPLALGPAANADAVACWVALGAEALFQDEVGALYREVIAERKARLLALLRAACREEGRSARALEPLATTILAAVEGTFQLATAAPGSVPAGSAAGSLRRVVDALLDARPPTHASPKGAPR